MSHQVDSSLDRWLERMTSGDPEVRNQILSRAQDRLRKIARRMLRQFPHVRQQVDTDDILQNLLQRMDRVLQEVSMDSAQDFFRLASFKARQVLLDAARKYRHVIKHHRTANPDSTHSNNGALRAIDTTNEPHRIMQWEDFHEAVDRLNEKLREAFDLIWYQDLTQSEAAEVVGVSVRTIKRRWLDARLALADLLGGDFPN